VFCLIAAGSLFAEPVTSAINYVASSAVYIRAGRLQGIQVGDSAVVLRKDQAIARLQVIFAADSTASCKILSSESVLRVGDAVTIFIRPMETQPDIATNTEATKISTETAAKPQTAASRKNRLSGRVGFQLSGQDSRDDGDYDYYQPALSLRMRVDRLFDSPLAVNVRLNARKMIRKTQFPFAPRSEWNNRIYELSLEYRDPAARFEYAAGRILSNRLSGMGYLDGALVNYKASHRLSVGAFGGAEPDLQTSRVNASHSKAGAFVSYDQNRNTDVTYNATLAAVGEYVKGTINREFLYQQAGYNLGTKFSGWESAEININRGWRKTAVGHSIDFSNFLLNLRYAPTSALAFNAGYDNRNPYRTYETRILSDSLFDTALQQGYQAGLELKLPLNLRVDARGTLQTRQTEKSSARSISGGLTAANVLDSRLLVSLRGTTYTNRFSEGSQQSLSLSRNLGNALNLGLQVGHEQYSIKGETNFDADNLWYRINADCLFGRYVYSSANLELDRGDREANRYFAELGFRF
jgi:hypothetical protein